MKYQLEIEINDSNDNAFIDFVERFFKNIAFVKKVKVAAKNEITNPDILQSIEEYEANEAVATSFNLDEWKKALPHA